MNTKLTDNLNKLSLFFKKFIFFNRKFYILGFIVSMGFFLHSRNALKNTTSFHCFCGEKIIKPNGENSEKNLHLHIEEKTPVVYEVDVTSLRDSPGTKNNIQHGAPCENNNDEKMLKIEVLPGESPEEDEKDTFQEGEVITLRISN